MFDDHDISRLNGLAQEYNLSLPILLSVIRVESGGKAFTIVNGRKEPLIRFEGHYFYRLLNKTDRHQAVVKGLASVKAGGVRNPRKQMLRWHMLERASKIDRIAALSSVSWGVGQVMGAHWQWLGFASVDALVDCARSSLEGQVRLMLEFIARSDLVPLLQQKDWAGFARRYNGPQFHKNKYEIKLAREHLRYQGKNTNIRNIREGKYQKLNLRMGLRGATVRELQRQLNAQGFSLAPDGDFGPATQSAVIRFQVANQLAGDGIVGPKTAMALLRREPVAAQ